jgi:hypothetical protein
LLLLILLASLRRNDRSAAGNEKLKGQKTCAATARDYSTMISAGCKSHDRLGPVHLVITHETMEGKKIRYETKNLAIRRRWPERPVAGTLIAETIENEAELPSALRLDD